MNKVSKCKSCRGAGTVYVTDFCTFDRVMSCPKCFPKNYSIENKKLQEELIKEDKKRVRK